MRRLSTGLLVSVTALLVGLIGSVFMVAALVRNDRQTLVQALGAERAFELEREARVVGDGLTDVAEDVRFAGEMLGEGGGPEAREQELRALLRAVGKYKAIVAFDAAGAEVLRLVDPRFPDLGRADFAKAAREALSKPGVVLVSAPLDDRGMLRTFATGYDDEAGRLKGAVVLLIDVSPLVTQLAVLGKWPLLLIGPHGLPLAPSDANLAALFRSPSAAPEELKEPLAHLAHGDTGWSLVRGPTAAAVGLPDAEAIFSYAAIPVAGGSNWAIGSLSSAQLGGSTERSLVTRLTLLVAVLAALFAAVGAALVVARRRTAELDESLRHSEALTRTRDVMRHVLDGMPAAVVAVAPDLTITFVNRALARRVPSIREGAALEGVWSDAEPRTRERLSGLVAEAHTSATPRQLVAEPLHFGGLEGSFSISAIPVPRPEIGLGLLLVLDDVTELRALEGQLLRAEKLSTVGALAAGFAHEIGTPLAVVRGRAEYLRKNLGTGHEGAPGLSTIIEQIDLVSRIVRQLLDFSRDQPALTQPLGARTVVEAVRLLLDLEAQRRNVSLVLQPGDEVVVSADPDQLQQVLVNLVMNAFDASKPGQAIELSVVRRADHAEFEVTDHGDGLDEQAQRRMFDPFWTTKKRGQGTGLGLTVVAQIVRSHHGTVRVRSAPGAGTSLIVSWPLAVESR